MSIAKKSYYKSKQNSHVLPEVKDVLREFVKTVNPVKASLDCVNHLNEELTSIMTDPKYKYLSKLFRRGGNSIGILVDLAYPDFLCFSSGLSFIHGNDEKDTDCICLEYSDHNHELKTSYSANSAITGSKSKSSDNSTKYFSDDPVKYVFIFFHRGETGPAYPLRVKKIQVAYVRPSDWKYNGPAEKSCSLSDTAKRENVITIYTDYLNSEPKIYEF